MHIWRTERHNMAPSNVISSLVLFCLLLLQLPAQHGASYHTSYIQGSRQIIFKSPGNSHASTVPPPTCSSIATGLGNNKLPVVHRLSPCSPQGQPSLTAADVLRRDTHRIRRRFASKQSAEVAAVPALAPAPSPAAVTIPTNGSSDPMTTQPGALDYSVLISYGTPVQQFPVFLDTSIGTSLLRCKPCAFGSDNCDPAFDTSRSSTFARIPCGSPECPANCSSSACPFDSPQIPVHGTFARDLLMLAPSSTAVHDFRFVCLDVARPANLPEVGTLDLSRDPNSLPSRLSPSSLPAFSYCLPQYPSSQGFLSLGSNATVGDGRQGTTHAALVSSSDPELAGMYFVDLVGMSLGGEDLPIPAGTFGNASTNLDVGTAITMLAPGAYTPLRDSFRKQMSQYPLAPGIAGFDTCYNFTGMNVLIAPVLELKFSNGESLEIHVDQLLYYDDPAAGLFTMSCLAFSTLDSGDGGDGLSAVIGTYTLTSTEVVYDVAGGKVSFSPGSC